MNEEKIEVVYFDGEPIVYRDGNRLNEKEIVDLLVEYFEDCDALIKENEQLKQSNNEAIELILDGIVEMHDGKRDYAESIFNKAIKLLRGDVE